VGDRRDAYRVLGGNLREDLGVDEMIILKGIFKELIGGIDRKDLTKDRARFRDFQITVIGVRIE